MKKLVMLLSMLVLILPIVAAEVKIFSGKVITDHDHVLPEGIFKFRYDETSQKAFVQTPTTGLIIDNGACNHNEVFRVCINKANFSYRNSTTWVYYYEIDTTIYKLTGSLTATTKVSLYTLLQGEPADFKITITNPTNFDITDILYKEDLSTFFIKELKGCQLDGKNIVWEGSLKSKYDRICTATIIPTQEGKYKLVGNLSYFNGFENEKKTTDTVTITVLPKQLNVSKFIDPNIEVKKPFHINMSLKNLHKDEKIEARITIELPKHIMLLKKVAGFNKDFNILTRSLILEPSTMFNYSFYLEANSESNAPINQKFDYTIKNIREVIEDDIFVNPLEPKPVINFTTEYVELVPGQKFIVAVKLKNPSIFHKLTNIRATLNSPYNDQIVENLNELMPNDSYSIISNTLIIPKNVDVTPETGNKTINLELAIGYEFNRVSKLINKSFALKIKPLLSTETNITVTTETLSSNQSPQETKVDEAVPQKPSDEGTQISDKLNIEISRLSLKEKIILAAWIFIVTFAVPFAIYKIKKIKKENK